jgi:hypothetical protein
MQTHAEMVVYTGRRRAEQETAAWTFPRTAGGDGWVTHEVQSGRGLRQGFLADTRWSHGGWAHRALQRPEDHSVGGSALTKRGLRPWSVRPR